MRCPQCRCEVDSHQICPFCGAKVCTHDSALNYGPYAPPLNRKIATPPVDKEGAEDLTRSVLKLETKLNLVLVFSISCFVLVIVALIAFALH